MGGKQWEAGRVLGAVALAAALAGGAWGAMGPGKGLPQGWTPTPARGLGAIGPLDGNAISGMCVECHVSNPSARTRPLGTIPAGDPEPLHRGSHFVRHRLDGFDRVTSHLEWERLDPWPSGARSRYGNFATRKSVEGEQGDLICESCHSLLKNVVDSTPRNVLLLQVFDKGTGAAPLCLGCHSGITGPPNHHPLGAADNTDGPGTRNPPLDAAKSGGVRYFSAPNVVSCVSCHKPHRAMTGSGARLLRRGASQVGSITGVLEKPVNVVYYAGKPTTYKGVAVAYQVGDTANFSRGTGENLPDAAGLYRQSDFAPYGERAVYDAGPLCDACHKHND